MLESLRVELLEKLLDVPLDRRRVLPDRCRVDGRPHQILTFYWGAGMANPYRSIATAVAAAVALAALTACGIGKPIPIPEPESQLSSKPGLFSDDNGEFVVYRKQ